MRKYIIAGLLLLATLKLSATESNFDFGWRFHLCTAEQAAAQMPSAWDWTPVQLPHDWNTTTDFDPSGNGSAGFQNGGTGWYAKSFKAPSSWAGKTVSLMFDGVYDNATIYLNGKQIDYHFYGFTAFETDLTPHLQYGKDNELMVKVNHKDYARWYTGSGINRHVYLRVVEPVHVKTYGTYITTPEISAQKASVRIVTTLENDSAKSAGVQLVQTIKDEDGTVVAKNTTPVDLAPGQKDVEQNLSVAHPRIWDIDSPHRYTVETQVKAGGRVADRYESRFGIRTVNFEPEKGFWLNGKNMKLKGMCLHQDAGVFGSAIPYRMHERRVKILKEFGVNAIRCSHNPPSRELLDICDSLGMLVIDEAFDKWTTGYYGVRFNTGEGWKEDMRSMIERDRNHPSIILWSIGNEVAENGMTTDEGIDRAHMINDFVHQLEPSRMTTTAMHPSYNEKFLTAADVMGYNYAELSYLDDRKTHPTLMGYISESYPYYSGLRPHESRDYSSFNPWNHVAQNDCLIGSFMWAGIDYWGESSGWPSKGWPSCPFDMCMDEKPFGAYFRSVWKDEPVIRLCVMDYSLDIDPGKDHWQMPGMVHDWNLPYTDDRVIPILVPSNCDEVWLYDRAKNKSYGPRRPADYENGVVVWNQPYHPGTIVAVGYRNGVEVCRDSLVTSGPKALDYTLTPDRNELKSNGMDYAFVDVQLLDGNGIPVRIDDRTVSASIVEGDATIVGINSLEMRRDARMNSPVLPTKFGRCQVVVKSGTGGKPSVLKVSVEGLGEKTVTLAVAGSGEKTAVRTVAVK